jgi:ribosomal protein S12 methylthiotransferase
MIDIISLGCSKNLVDSETLQRLFLKNGLRCVIDAPKVTGDTVIINTCGFIEDAKQESIDTILQFADAKTKGSIRHLYVMGCLSQRYMEELQQEIPEVDKYYGKFDWKGLVEECSKNVTPSSKISPKANKASQATKYSCYIKISEGCDRHCAYCAIPLITGKHQSRDIEDILDEVRARVKEGVKEFNVIAQELTYYGVDKDGKRHIAELIKKMADIPGVHWIRLHYAYPTQFPMDLLKVMREKENVCKYLDIALQHISTNVLSNMRRKTTKEETIELIKRLREEVPGICLRTTMMVGYPGETEEDFNELIDFVKWARFERLGAFAYSEEEGTYSAEHFKDDIPEEVKQARLSKLMRVQQRISHEIMDENIGKTLEVVIDRIENDYYIARSQYSSPEVDPEILISAEDVQLKVGEFYNVEITDSEDFDLYAKIK